MEQGGREGRGGAILPAGLVMGMVRRGGGYVPPMLACMQRGRAQKWGGCTTRGGAQRGWPPTSLHPSDGRVHTDTDKGRELEERCHGW
jgi:hypothetical protein